MINDKVFNSIIQLDEFCSKIKMKVHNEENIYKFIKDSDDSIDLYTNNDVLCRYGISCINIIDVIGTLLQDYAVGIIQDFEIVEKCKEPVIVLNKDEQYNKKKEKQPMDNTSNAYTYRAKKINWKNSTKDEEKQYVTGNIVTVGDRYFIVNPEIVNDCGLTGLSFDNGFTEIDKNTIEPVIDNKKEILIKVHSELTDLSDATIDEELAALCDACDYNYDTLAEWNKECKLLAQGVIVRSNFARALTESFYNDDNALIDYAKEYKEFMNEPPVKSKNIKSKDSDREL